MRANHVRRRLAAGNRRSAPGSPSPRPRPRSMSAASGSTGSLSTPSTTRSISGRCPDVRGDGRQHHRADGAYPVEQPENFKRVLDAGAWGVVVPMVNSREEAEQAVSAARYFPNGKRSVGGGADRCRSIPGPRSISATPTTRFCSCCRSSTSRGWRRGRDPELPGVDACFIGPNDLAASMGMGLGVPLESDHPRLVEAITEIRNACAQRCRSWYSHVGSGRRQSAHRGRFQFWPWPASCATCFPDCARTWQS